MHYKSYYIHTDVHVYNFIHLKLQCEYSNIHVHVCINYIHTDVYNFIHLKLQCEYSVNILITFTCMH